MIIRLQNGFGKHTPYIRNAVNMVPTSNKDLVNFSEAEINEGQGQLNKVLFVLK